MQCIECFDPNVIALKVIVLNVIIFGILFSIFCHISHISVSYLCHPVTYNVLITIHTTHITDLTSYYFCLPLISQNNKFLKRIHVHISGQTKFNYQCLLANQPVISNSLVDCTKLYFSSA